jgi:hypothetical protein
MALKISTRADKRAGQSITLNPQARWQLLLVRRTPDLNSRTPCRSWLLASAQRHFTAPTTPSCNVLFFSDHIQKSQLLQKRLQSIRHSNTTKKYCQLGKFYKSWATERKKLVGQQGTYNMHVVSNNIQHFSWCLYYFARNYIVFVKLYEMY